MIVLGIDFQIAYLYFIIPFVDCVSQTTFHKIHNHITIHEKGLRVQARVNVRPRIECAWR